MIGKLVALFLWGLLALPLVVFAQNDAPTQFSNVDSVRNTRHNMQQDTLPNGGPEMNNYRNRYNQVCVYCHTPHSANTTTAAPLWNRLVGPQLGQSYTLYSSSTINGVVNSPGAASLPCLSCHDGTQATDAILNMPGSGQYQATPNPGNFVPTGAGEFKSNQHTGLASRQIGSGAPTATTTLGCMSCHNSTSGTGQINDPTDFTAFYIGTDLTNDHPIGVAFPTTNGAGTDWKTPSGTKVAGAFTNKFFDENSNGRMDKGDIRLYDSGNGASVECASCHDPHGVPSAGAGSVFNPTFLRKTNVGSAVCLTCHNK